MRRSNAVTLPEPTGSSPAAGEVDLFPQEITRVLLNLISNGFYAATKRKAEGNGGTSNLPLRLAPIKVLV